MVYGPNEKKRQASPDNLPTYNANQVLNAHREVYASVNSDELQASESYRVYRRAHS